MINTSPDNGKKRGWIDGSFFVLFIAALMSVLSLSLDILLPVLPDISVDFSHSDSAGVRSVLTVFMFAFGLGHLYAGLLADRYGRRPILVASLGIYILAGIFCAVAPSFEALLFGRFIQGLAAAGPRVIAVAILRDLRSGADLARTLSMAMMVFMAAPIIAPFIGEITAAIGGWRSVCAVLVGLAIPLLIIVQFFLPETCPPAQRARIRPALIQTNLRMMAASAQTLGNKAIATLIYGAMFGFFGIAPIIYGEVYGISIGFAGYFATFGAGIALAAFTNTRLLVQYAPARILTGALFAMTVIALFFLAACLYAKPSFWLFHLFMMALMYTKGLIFTNCNALAVEPHRDFAGLASSVIGGGTMLGSALIAHIFGGLYDGNVVLIAAVYCGIGALAILAALSSNRQV